MAHRATARDGLKLASFFGGIHRGVVPRIAERVSNIPKIPGVHCFKSGTIVPCKLIKPIEIVLLDAEMLKKLS